MCIVKQCHDLASAQRLNGSGAKYPKLESWEVYKLPVVVSPYVVSFLPDQACYAVQCLQIGKPGKGLNQMYKTLQQPTELDTHCSSRGSNPRDAAVPTHGRRDCSQTSLIHVFRPDCSPGADVIVGTLSSRDPAEFQRISIRSLNVI